MRGAALEHGDTVAILDAREAKRIGTLTADGGARLAPEGGARRPLVFSRDSRYLVGLGKNKTLVWDLKPPDANAPVVRLPATLGLLP